MKINTIKKVAAGILLTAVVISPAFASNIKIGNSASQQTVTVSFGDLNMTRTEGAATLYSRLKNATGQVCGSHFGKQSLSVVLEQRECVTDSLDTAVKRIDNTYLTDIHSS